MGWVLDRFEGEKAVLEDIRTRAVRSCMREELPPDAHEGDVLRQTDAGLVIDHTQTRQRATDIAQRFKRLTNPGRR